MTSNPPPPSGVVIEQSIDPIDNPFTQHCKRMNVGLMIQTRDVALSAVISLHSSDGVNGWDSSADGTKAVLPGGPWHDCDSG